MAGGSAGVGIPEDLLVGVVHRGELSVLRRLLCPRAPAVRGLDLAQRGIERGAVEIRADIGARAGGIPELAPQFGPSLVEEKPGALPVALRVVDTPERRNSQQSRRLSRRPDHRYDTRPCRPTASSDRRRRVG